MELTSKVSVIVEDGLIRFWLADRFPHPNPTTVVGPFQGNAIKKLNLPKVLREGIAERNFSSHMQTISGLLSSDEMNLAKLGLEALPFAMEQDVRDVDSFLHFAERSLPRRVEAFEKMGLAKKTKAALASMEKARKRIKAVAVEAVRPGYQPGYDPRKERRKERRNGIGVLPETAWGEEKDGLQAALTAPEELELNERITVWFVFRNVSDTTLRVSLPEVTRQPSFWICRDSASVGRGNRRYWRAPAIAHALGSGAGSPGHGPLPATPDHEEGRAPVTKRRL